MEIEWYKCEGEFEGDPDTIWESAVVLDGQLYRGCDTLLFHSPSRDNKDRDKDAAPVVGEPWEARAIVGDHLDEVAFITFPFVSYDDARSRAERLLPQAMEALARTNDLVARAYEAGVSREREEIVAEFEAIADSNEKFIQTAGVTPSLADYLRESAEAHRVHAANIRRRGKDGAK